MRDNTDTRYRHTTRDAAQTHNINLLYSHMTQRHRQIGRQTHESKTHTYDASRLQATYENEGEKLIHVLYSIQ
ncbi:hypothetical protein ABIE27_004564 [Paenibacillus sp. 4624]